MSLVVVTGMSGSGKSVALAVLEDEGFYCVDNLPVALIGPLVKSQQALHLIARQDRYFNLWNRPFV
ncbi:MAG: hypothetical protein EBR20_10625, partial [Bacteroidetes bacterium]|nr:hypothetical protein [Bacteroidota bacterium]